MDKRYLKFKVALAEKGWTYDDLAKETETSRQNIYSFMQTLKKGGNPQGINAIKYAKSLGIPVEEIL